MDFSIHNDNGIVAAFGNNFFGQLGLGDTKSRFTPVEITDIRAKEIACGDEHSMIIDLNNNVWAFGSNVNGELGLGDTQNRSNPTRISTFSGLSESKAKAKAKAISCGNCHSLIIDLNNNVWAFGDNEYGQLGLNDRENRSIPTEIYGIQAKSISCGNFHSMIIDLNNNIWAFGRNEYGELGLGDMENRSSPTLSGLAVKQAKAISCGLHHTIIIDINNNVWAFGSNMSGQSRYGRAAGFRL